jgi:capsular polysaccharide biosynthesis protein
VKFVLHYLQIPFRRPRLLLALTALPVIMALIFTTLSPSPYQTSAVVALIKTRTDVTFDERIRTVTGEDPVTTTRSSSSVQDRANELAALVENGAIATDVIVRLKDQLPEAYRDPQVLVGKINATVMNPGGMIAVTAVDSDPEMAALLANTWASSYEQYVNTLYSGAATGYSKSVQTELQRAKGSYEEAQGALEAFLPTNKVDALTREIADKEAMLDVLSTGKTTAISTTIEQQLLNQTQIINAYMTAQVSNQLLAFNKQQEAKRTLLGEFIDAEIESRMRALRYDRTMRENAFSVTSEADLTNKLAVVQQEAETKREALAQSYAEQTRLRKLLGNAVSASSSRGRRKGIWR